MSSPSIAAVAGNDIRLDTWRRATGERRQQLKWLACGAAIAAIAIPLAALLGSAIPIVGIAALPVGISVGILKSRLYEIDRIIGDSNKRLARMISPA